MAQTLCIKCGSELKVSSYCQFCQEPLIFACTSCDYITEEKVHTDCRNAEVLAKTTTTAQEVAAAAATDTTTAPPHTTGSIVDKLKEEETVKAEPSSAPPYMTREQDKENNNNDLNNPNPLVAGAAVWQSLMTYWFNAYGEFLRNAPKMTEYWYDAYWKPWLNWMAQRQGQDKDRVKIE